VRLLPISHLHYWRKMEVCLINLNKGEDDEGWVFKILQYSEMEYNCVRKITEGLFRKYSTL
jgi:nitrous oxidase accessory protein NosD